MQVEVKDLKSKLERVDGLSKFQRDQLTKQAKKAHHLTLTDRILKLELEINEETTTLDHL